MVGPTQLRTVLIAASDEDRLTVRQGRIYKSASNDMHATSAGAGEERRLWRRTPSRCHEWTVLSSAGGKSGSPEHQGYFRWDLSEPDNQGTHPGRHSRELGTVASRRKPTSETQRGQRRESPGPAVGHRRCHHYYPTNEPITGLKTGKIWYNIRRTSAGDRVRSPSRQLWDVPNAHPPLHFPAHEGTDGAV